MISVALIEDNRLVREGLTALLNQMPDLEVVAVASSGDLELLGKANPQVILMDIGLGENDSLRLARAMREEFPESRLIMMDLLPVHEDVIDFVNAGISGFILKDATLAELAGTIRSVAGGAHVLPAAMTSTLFSQIAKEGVARSRAVALESVRMTPREREVILLIGEGLSNKEIGGRLNIAVHTVKSHVRNVMEKLTLHSRLQIAAYAHKRSAS